MDEDQYAILAQLARRSRAKLLSCKAAGVPLPGGAGQQYAYRLCAGEGAHPCSGRDANRGPGSLAVDLLVDHL